MSALAESLAPDAERPKEPMGRKISGRDAKLPDWLVERRCAKEQPAYDSAVILGNGIGALCVAARLARSQRFAGKLLLVGKPPVESRRLINGLTLRSRGLDYIAASLGVSRSEFVSALFEGREREFASTHQWAARFSRDPAGQYRLGKHGEWMSRWNHQGRTLSFGMRNSRLVQTIYRFMEGLPFEWKDQRPGSLSDCIELAPGKRPIVINATPMPLAGTGVVRKAPKRFVVAAQCLFSNAGQRAARILPPNTSLFMASGRAGAMDAAVWYPTFDPMSPTAGIYGIHYRIVKSGPRLHKQAEIAVQQDHLFGIGKLLGFEAVDPDETLGTAMVPCSHWSDLQPQTPGYLHLHRIANSGTPIIAGDGIARAALTGYVLGESLLAGAAALSLGNRAAWGWAQRNRVTHHALSTLTPLTDLLARFAPGFALNLIQDFGETWAGLE